MTLPEERHDLMEDWERKPSEQHGKMGSVRAVLAALNPRHVFFGILDILRPEALSRWKAPVSARKGTPTAWLDGLRGVAAFGVCIMHLTVFTHPGLELCYGTTLLSGKPNHSPIALPLIRLPFLSGHFAVMLFFVISGYVVPRRMISLLHQGRKDEFVEAVNSAMFRRSLRLLLPVLWSTLILAVMWHFPFTVHTPFPPHKDGLWSELFSWLKESLTFVFFFKRGILWTYYNAHSWTIPVELRGSMFMFTWLFTLHQTSTRTRILATVGMILFLAIGTYGAWYAAFFGGMVLSELDLLASEQEPIKLPWDGISNYFNRIPRIRKILLHFMLLCALYLASQPSSDWFKKDETLGNCPGWITLAKLIPEAYEREGSNHRWFWLFWAAWTVVYGIREITWIRGIFETSPAQYLGRHSFALYLVHGPLIGLFSDRLFYLTGFKTPEMEQAFEPYFKYYNKWHDASWYPIPDGGPWGLEYNFVFCVFLSIPVMLYCAEVGTRVFDNPSVKLSSWAWKKLKQL